MAVRTPGTERLTVAAAAAFVCSVGLVKALPSFGAVSTPLLVLSGLSFLALYVRG